MYVSSANWSESRSLNELAPRVTLWVAPDASHAAAFRRYPEEYERRVIEFFTANSLSSSGRVVCMDKPSMC